MENQLSVFDKHSKKQLKSVAVAFKPDITDEEYNEMWNDFMQLNENVKQVERN